MSFLLLGLALLLAVQVMVATAFSLLVAALFPLLGGLLGGMDPARRARALFGLGMLPAAAGLVAALLVALPAWIFHEPRGSGEHPGPVVAALAAAGTLLVLARVGAAVSDLRRTGRLVKQWQARGRELRGLSLPATRFAHDFPLAGLAGLLRPRLLLAEPVLRTLERDELLAVVEHERAHAEARDNLRRLLLQASPDPLALTRMGARLRAEFEEAAEAAADAAAAVRVAPLSLARALLKVAALVPAGRRLEASLATLHREGLLAARVRTLVDASGRPPAGAETGHRARGLLWLAPPAVLVLAAVVLALLPAVHQLLEALVHAPAGR